MLAWVSRQGFPRQGLGVTVTYGIKVGLSPWDTGWQKPHDPRFISFDALPVCDRQTDMLPVAKPCSSISECDKHLPAK